MNASEEPMIDAGFAQQASQNVAPGQVGLDENAVASAFSALMDGSISDQEWDALWESSHSHSAVLEDWNVYQVVGDALRGGVPLAAATAPASFLASFQARFHQELSAAPGQPVNEMPLVSTPPVHVVRGSAANDSIFRWKVLAVVASVSAVMAVSWGVLGTVMGDRASQTGSELAMATPPAPPAAVVVAEPSDASSSVIVNTGQGPLIRDARLEALLAEHRQYGGMSALQKPAGFLRNATYDAPAR